MFLFIFFLILLFVGSHGQSNCGGTPNQLPIVTNTPTLVRTVQNGKLYQVGSPIVDPPLLIAHLYGTPYEMGLAHGQLLKKEINALLPEFNDWILAMVEQYIDFLPTELVEVIETLGLDAALDLTYLATRKYISNDWKNEMQGIADGVGVELDRRFVYESSNIFVCFVFLVVERKENHLTNTFDRKNGTIFFE